jgi:pilus assembly protein CpaD
MQIKKARYPKLVMAPSARTLARRAASLPRNLLPLCLVLALAGCGTTNQMVVSSVPQDDYQVRHPIVLAEEPYKLQILVEPVSGRFDGRSAARLREFAVLYKKFGRGPITIASPVGPGGPPSTEPVRHALWRAGAHVRTVITPYPAGPNPVAPIRLSFSGLKATVADRCGQWPRDLGIGSGAPEDWSNKPYWNFGCAYQTAFAAQVADPRDLVSPQAETPADTIMRTRTIDNRRKALDPSSWRITTAPISAVGATAEGGQQ